MKAVDLVILLIGAAIAGGAFLFARRYGGGAALEQLERANRVLTARVNELETLSTSQASELAKLRVETNVSLVIAPVIEALRSHEQGAMQRSEAVLGVLHMIAERLGPDPEPQAA